MKRENLIKNQSREAQPLASSGVGEGVVREGEGSDFAIQAPTPSLKENARGQKWDSNADLSAQRREKIDSANISQGGWLLRNARKSFGLPRSHSLARNDEILDSSLRLRSAQNDNVGESLLKFLLLLAFAKSRVPLNFTDSNLPNKVDSQNLNYFIFKRT